MKTDVQIAQAATLQPILNIAKKIGLTEDDIEYYGKYKAKISLDLLGKKEAKGKLVLVTAINPTPAGEGKTTTVVGLGDGLNYIGKQTVLALREPSLGPVFGMKGGAAGGGYAQVLPMEDINLHFTGDFSAIGAATNLLAALLDNHVFQGNDLKINPATITLKRVVDMNDRQLRNIVDGLGGKFNGYPREDGFEIVVASEVMAILCLAKDLKDLKEKLGNIIVAENYNGEPVTARDLKADGAMTALLKDAIKPNLVQTIEGTPALIHGGPFANIAHGCNSIIATNFALQNADYVVTEAGFGADLGAEKFLDIKCRLNGLSPDAVVVVATIKALKMHGGLAKDELGKEDVEALKNGLPNLLQHIANVKEVFGLNCIVAINKFPTDTENEMTSIVEECKKLGVEVVISDVWANGGKGGADLAHAVVKACEEKTTLQYPYELSDSIKVKIEKLVEKVYRGKSVQFANPALTKMKKIESLDYGNLPICVAKTQYSFSDNPKLLGAPTDFEMAVRDVKLNAGAGFVVVYFGQILTMPGLPKVPAANNIDIDENGVITGLF